MFPLEPVNFTLPEPVSVAKVTPLFFFKNKRTNEIVEAE